MAKSKITIRNHKHEENIFIRRVIVLIVFMLICTGILLMNIYKLQITDYDIYRTRSNTNRIKVSLKPPTRGIIYDRHGKILADNKATLGLFVVPEKVPSLNKTLEQLKDLVGLTNEEIEIFNKNFQNRTRYIPIVLKESLTEEQRARFAVNQYLFPYIEVLPNYTRFYPYGEIMGHILGYVGKPNIKDIDILKERDLLNEYLSINKIGKAGIEKYYENDLRGMQGYEEVEVNSRGKVVRTLKEQNAVAGKNIKLTIDIDLQQYIYALMEDRNGAVVVLDPKDGSVLSMVSYPGYDNNLFVGGINNKKYSALLNNENHPLTNRAIQSLYPPASTSKPFTSLALLQEKIVTPKTLIYSPGSWSLPNSSHLYRDAHSSGYGNINIMQAITYSSDTFYYQTIFELGIDRLHNWMDKFGFGRKTGLDLNEGTSGIMPSKKWKKQRWKSDWLQGDTIPVSIGQGYWNTSVLHLAKALTIIVNNGVIYTPHLLKEKISSDIEPYQQYENEDPIIVDDDNYWEIIKAGMIGVIERGTGARVFAGSKYKVAGKTGTAQLFNLKGSTYNKNDVAKILRDHSLFIAYAPVDKPKLVLAIVIENGGFGAAAAAPMSRQIIDYYLGKEHNVGINEIKQNDQ